jgi:predicted AAA+ superfamily ATPase
MDWNLFYSSYVSSYVERDVRQISNIGSEHTFLTFLRVAAAWTGQILNYSDMASDVGVSVSTIKSWLSLLETSGLVYLLQPYSRNVTSRAIKTPKLYFFDTGLACWLTGWETAEVLQNGAMNGAMLETYVVSEIIKSYWHNGQRANVWFYRDKDKKEIDLLIEANACLHPIEIKRTAAPTLSDVKNFDILKATKAKIGTGALICLIDTPLPLSDNIVAMPLTYI